MDSMAIVGRFLLDVVLAYEFVSVRLSWLLSASECT